MSIVRLGPYVQANLACIDAILGNEPSRSEVVARAVLRNAAEELVSRIGADYEFKGDEDSLLEEAFGTLGAAIEEFAGVALNGTTEVPSGS